jgi:hypothetical protein
MLESSASYTNRESSDFNKTPPKKKEEKKYIYIYHTIECVVRRK